jgi:hypothetical protein
MQTSLMRHVQHGTSYQPDVMRRNVIHCNAHKLSTAQAGVCAKQTVQHPSTTTFLVTQGRLAKP